MAATDVEIDSQPIKEVNSTSRGEDTGTLQVTAAAQSGGGPKKLGRPPTGKKASGAGRETSNTREEIKGRKVRCPLSFMRT